MRPQGGSDSESEEYTQESHVGGYGGFQSYKNDVDGPSYSANDFDNHVNKNRTQQRSHPPKRMRPRRRAPSQSDTSAGEDNGVANAALSSIKLKKKPQPTTVQHNAMYDGRSTHPCIRGQETRN